MSTLTIVLVAIGAVALAFLLLAERSDNSVGIFVAKPVASTAFIATAVSAGAPDTSYGIGILVALILSWFGDVFLMFRDSRALFLAGLVSFLLGHVAYGAAYVIRGVVPLWAAVAAAALVVVALVVARWLLPSVEAPMKVPVIAYITVISAMVALAVATVVAHGYPLVLAAAVLFYLSDLTVARDRFVSRGFINRAIGLPLYYGAQFLFAATVGAAAVPA